MRSPIPCRGSSIDLLMAQHEGLVHAVVRRQWGGALSYEERLHAGHIGLWQALQHYDPSRGTAFSTYAWPAIARQVWRAVRLAETEAGATPVSPLPDPDEGLLRDEVCRALHILVDRLPGMLRPVVVAYFGLADEPPRSLRQIGRQMGLSHEAVRLRLWAGLVWLRHPAHSLTLNASCWSATVAPSTSMPIGLPRPGCESEVAAVHANYADYASAFGFQPGRYPTESGLRYFLTTIGKKNLNTLIEQSVDLVRQSGLITPEVAGEAIVSFDGMIHDAASRMRCSATKETCYQPTSAEQPRPCPAREKGQRGCDCKTIFCKQSCYHATPRDPDARFVWYSGSNKGNHPNAPTANGNAAATSPDPASAPPKSPNGEGRFGFRSLRSVLVDVVHRTMWVLGLADLAAANTHEDGPGAELLKHIVAVYAWLHIHYAIGDSAFGYESFLAAAYELRVRRVVDLRSDPRTDNNKEEWKTRGYNGKGWLVCPFGFLLHPNGYYEERQRSKWCCRQRCEQSAASDGRPDCPYRDRERHALGLVKNIGRNFDDGSLRLVRDVPFGSPFWKELYRRARNAVESRNSTLEDWELKRLSVFSIQRAQATIFLADVWVNLATMARLIKEATIAQAAQAKAA